MGNEGINETVDGVRGSNDRDAQVMPSCHISSDRPDARNRRWEQSGAESGKPLLDSGTRGERDHIGGSNCSTIGVSDRCGDRPIGDHLIDLPPELTQTAGKHVSGDFSRWVQHPTRSRRIDMRGQWERLEQRFGDETLRDEVGNKFVAGQLGNGGGANSGDTHITEITRIAQQATKPGHGIG
jgi:hypothetical protein